MPEWDDRASKHQCFKKMKTTVSEKVSFENETFWREHTETLIKQGHFLCLTMLIKICHDLEILHVQSEERYTEISTQLLFGHPANTNQP